MKIVSLEAMNFMKLREIRVLLKDKGLTQITGKNGAGKSTLLKFIEWMIDGPTSVDIKLKQSIVRRGSNGASGKLILNDPAIGKYIVTRTLSAGGTHNLDIFDQHDVRVKDQQGWLKKLITGLTFDPLHFAQMGTDDQVAELKRLAHVDIDYAAMAQADKEDADERKAVKKEVQQLEIQIEAIGDTADVGTTKVDEGAILKRMREAGEKNQEAQRINQQKESMRLEVVALEQERSRKVDLAEEIRHKIAGLKNELEQTEKQMVKLAEQVEKAEAKHKAAPEGKMVDVAALTAELEKAQRTNRQVDKLVRKQGFTDELETKRREVNRLTMQMEVREEKRRAAVAEAKLPVPGLTFDDKQVLFKGIPLLGLGEAERIRISTLLGMAMHPDLRAMCIQHGEALDDDGLNIIARLAEEHDFQILMARVETSGKIGIVLEDGLVVADNEEKKPATAAALPVAKKAIGKGVK